MYLSHPSYRMVFRVIVIAFHPQRPPHPHNLLRVSAGIVVFNCTTVRDRGLRDVYTITHEDMIWRVVRSQSP